MLAAEGVEVEVIDAFSVKPLDEDTVLASVGKTGRAVVAEEHSVYGGLGSAVAETLARSNPAPVATSSANRANSRSCSTTSTWVPGRLSKL